MPTTDINSQIITNPNIGFHWVETPRGDWQLESKPLPKSEALPYAGQKGIAVTENLRSALEAQDVDFTMVRTVEALENNTVVFIISNAASRTLGTHKGANDVAAIVGLEAKPVTERRTAPAAGVNSHFAAAAR